MAAAQQDRQAAAVPSPGAFPCLLHTIRPCRGPYVCACVGERGHSWLCKQQEQRYQGKKVQHRQRKLSKFRTFFHFLAQQIFTDTVYVPGTMLGMRETAVEQIRSRRETD